MTDETFTLAARKILAANIRTFVECVGGSQIDLAKITGVPQKTISRVLNDENAANLDTLNLLAEGLGLEPWELLVPGYDPADPPVLLQDIDDGRSRGALKSDRRPANDVMKVTFRALYQMPDADRKRIMNDLQSIPTLREAAEQRADLADEARRLMRRRFRVLSEEAKSGRKVIMNFVPEPPNEPEISEQERNIQARVLDLFREGLEKDLGPSAYVKVIDLIKRLAEQLPSEPDKPAAAGNADSVEDPGSPWHKGSQG